MNRPMVFTIIIVLFIVLLSVNSHANWPTWRGPDSTGAAKKANPPVTWSETENIKWKVKVPGESLSSPIVWQDRIFFLTALKTDKPVPSTANNQAGGGRRTSQPPSAVYKFDIVCMSRKNGQILWQKTAREESPHEGHQATNSFASYSPVTDGKCVWASFGSRGVYCYDVNGNHKWDRDLGKMITANRYGEGSSPALAGDSLIVLMDQQNNSFIYALNKETGATLWKKARDERTGWTTPLPVEVNGQIQVVVNASNYVRSYDAKTGQILWRCSGQTRNAIPMPVSGFGMVFCMSGFRSSTLHAIELGRAGDLSGSRAIKWQADKGTPYVPSPLLYEDKLYFCSGNNAIISCYQADTGKANFQEQKIRGMRGMYASPVGAAGRVYLAGRYGKTTVIRHSDKFEILATNKLDDNFDATPAIVGNELFLKGKKNLYCIAKP